MKKLICLFLTILIVACDSDDNITNNELLISKIKYGDHPEWFTEFYYENDRLKFIFTGGCTGLGRYFEYNNSNKISKKYSFNSYDFDINTIDISEIINNQSSSTIFPISYIYENNKLDRLEDSDGIPFEFYTYYDNGLIESVEDSQVRIIIFYENDLVSYIDYYDLYNQNFYTYTFEFDDKVNPYYGRFSDFGFSKLEFCSESIRVMSLNYRPIFKNNITKVYKDNALRYSASYIYNSNNYPIKVITDDHFNNERETEIISY